ncbi:NAD(P)H oxidoreductase [Taibaiella lutea]|uniref:NAD(P)H oxidoreductase n=1 Tax=Taibaiella lutea TaxID=2608001 RepID=A0A5M6CPT8_9BACT|nr:NAD(P)H-dependent oxidoreductase [Taibaiella lutea]KAA5537016.1 NAD(P)H oxidoreductase [Taibaiella lutea]
MGKILLVTAHPALEKSRNNVRMLRVANELDKVTVRDLYELYPRFHINTKTEQHYLEESDVIVLQHPFYWYSTPALMKQYLDMVFTHGWAYGKEGNKLKGKIIFNSLTTSGTRESYHANEHNRYPLSSYLVPFNQLAHVCGMHYLPPYVLHESGKAFATESIRHAKKFKALLQMIVKDDCDIEKLKRLEYLNDFLEMEMPALNQ